MEENVSNLNPNISEPTGLGSISEQPVEVTPLAEPKKKSNGFIMTVLILIVLIIGGAAYLFFTDKLDIGIENPFSKKEEENISDDTDLDSITEEESTTEDEAKPYVFTEEDGEIVTKEFSFVDTDVIDGVEYDAEYKNEIRFPTGWTFAATPLEKGTMITECNKYTVSSSDGKTVLTITTVCSEFSSNTGADDLQSDFVGKYEEYTNAGLSEITIARVGVDSTTDNYIKGYSYDGSPVEYSTIMHISERLLESPGYDPEAWPSEISVSYTGSEEGRKVALAIVDKIVMSLKISEVVF